METWISVAFRHPVALLVSGMGVLWTSSLLFAPWWVSATGALLVLGVVATLLPFLKRRSHTGEHAGTGQLDHVRDDLDALLPRWSGMAHKTRDNLHDVQSQIHGVMQQTEQAVLNIGDCFRNITNKTEAQIKHALSLIQCARGIEEEVAGAGNDVARYAADTASVSAIADKIARFAEFCLEATARPTDVRSSLDLMEEVLQRSDLLLRKILSSGTTEKTLGSEADDIHRLSERARMNMNTWKQNLTAAHEGLRDLAEDAITAAAVIKSNAAQLAGEAAKKSREAAEIMDRINNLGEEVRKDIYKIIVDLQFQDITHQQLQRVKTPVLDELGLGLRAIADETHILYEKLRRRFVPQAMRTKKSAANGIALPKSDAPGQHNSNQTQTENKVELF